jgi:hypothetical protein
VLEFSARSYVRTDKVADHQDQLEGEGIHHGESSERCNALARAIFQVLKKHSFKESGKCMGVKLTLDNQMKGTFCRDSSLHPERAIKGAILDRFAHMFGGDLVAQLEVRDGAGDF